MIAQLSGALAALFIGSLCAAAPVENLKTVDRYGQFTGEEWPGKVTSDDQLRADAAKARSCTWRSLAARSRKM